MQLRPTLQILRRLMYRLRLFDGRKVFWEQKLPGFLRRIRNSPNRQASTPFSCLVMFYFFPLCFCFLLRSVTSCENALFDGFTASDLKFKEKSNSNFKN